MPISSTDQITVKTLNELKESGKTLYLLDVRTAQEHQLGNIGGVWIPLAELPTRLNELDADQEWVVYCRSGARSQQAVDFLDDEGINAKNLKGGMLAWRQEIDPTLQVEPK